MTNTDVVKKVRMQVPVTKGLAEEVNDVAKAIRRSQRWTAAELLAIVVENRQSLVAYLTTRVTKWLDQATEAIVDLIVPPPADSKSTVYLDLEVDGKTATYIQSLAQRLDHTPAKTAAIMLEWGIQENRLMIELVTVPVLAIHRGLKSLTNSTGDEERKQIA